MKKGLAIFFVGIVWILFSLDAAALPLATDTVRISKIRLSIDDLDYVVNDAGVDAERDRWEKREGCFTCPASGDNFVVSRRASRRYGFLGRASGQMPRGLNFG